MKRFDAFGDGKSIHFREGTSDETIIRSVIIDRNEYLFPKFSPKIIYDIGANIGVTTVLMARTYPDAHIVAFEPMADNFDLLVKNIAPYGDTHITCVKVALGRESCERTIHPSTDTANHGGFSLFEEGVDTSVGFKIRTLNINDAVEKYGIPQLIKVDAEGSEFEILTSMKTLKQVEWIAGELHGVNDYQLLAHLDLDFRTMVTKPFFGRTYPFHALLRNSELDRQAQQT